MQLPFLKAKGLLALLAAFFFAKTEWHERGMTQSHAARASEHKNGVCQRLRKGAKSAKGLAIGAAG